MASSLQLPVFSGEVLVVQDHGGDPGEIVKVARPEARFGPLGIACG